MQTSHTLFGHLQKLTTHIDSVPNAQVQYTLVLGDQKLHLNPLIGQTIRLEHLGQINCSHCGRKTKKSYSQGHCFVCMQKLPQCDLCIMSPERCHFDAGTCRDEAWGQAFCMQPHIVYLANSSGLKVGITRVNQMPTRWLDQGASQAMPIMQVATRKLSGQVETILKQYVADKTNWRKLLQSDAQHIDMTQAADALLNESEADLDVLLSELSHQDYQWLDTPAISMRYPVLEYPSKIKSHNLDKEPVLEGKLMGIKGQYLIFDTAVINIRKYTSYLVQLSS
ncbi:DUF2797 domain-containing protein [Oceanospirillaceae bacterium]|jgi:hypothetical protein|uniref:DUF2797 domain-containing protein n=1 Tax=Candidatus Njordibacter sp. Uisw_002 TaxID=3230971 RepID=UPI00236F2615|nr:DUF2797 domain-containing protein [Oceanospirillaceae bacterium]MDC1341704.1 DUF2797 domain-containing protein [Oceanospirillaceae bacterium]|tara:strand:- start:51 stop:893 length:843 start_codon:yes stop_codon:yes gene_type:complete